jgi:hypothetical protein
MAHDLVVVWLCNVQVAWSLQLSFVCVVHHCATAACGCDLQADNVLLKQEIPSGSNTSGSSSSAATTPSSSWRHLATLTAAAAAGGSVWSPDQQQQLVSKVADLGLASVLEDQDTHISGVHRVSADAVVMLALIYTSTPQHNYLVGFLLLCWRQLQSMQQTYTHSHASNWQCTLRV